VKVEGLSVRVGGLYGFLRYIPRLYTYLNPEGLIWFIFDNHTSKIDSRKLLDPLYKSNRVKKNPEFYRGIELLELMLLNHSDNFRVVSRTTWEADDLVKPIVAELSPYESIGLFSEDMDFSRLIDYGNRDIKWITKKGTYGKKKFLAKYGFVPTEQSVVLYKAIHGDSSDVIPNAVPRLPQNVLNEILENFVDAHDLIQNVDIVDFIPDLWKSRIKDAAKRILLNEKLVSFIKIDKSDVRDCIFKCRFKPKVLTHLYKIFNFSIHEVDKRLEEYNLIKLESEETPFSEMFR
jgi:hypothetical protein